MADIFEARKLKRTKIYILLVSGAAYIASLTQTAFTYNDFDGQKTHDALSALLMGALAILGGGFLEWVIWLANPLYFFALFLFVRSHKASRLVSRLAFILALSFLTWREILAAENGRMATIERLNSGYWLWIMSMATLALGTSYYFKRIVLDVHQNAERNG